MHQILRVVVYADNASEAVDVAQDLVEANYGRHYRDGAARRFGEFDYTTPMESGQHVSGSDRWTRYEGRPPAFPATSDAGSQEIEDAWETTIDGVHNQFDKVHEMLEDTLTEPSDYMMLRHEMQKVSADDPCISDCLFVQSPENRERLVMVSSPHTHESRVEDQDLSGMWVVPLDAHS